MTKNTIEISIDKNSKGSRILHIIVNGFELSGRSITKSENDKLFSDFIEFLNDKAQELLEEDPHFGWVNLSEWRGWANTYTNEYLSKSQKEQEDAIRASFK